MEVFLTIGENKMLFKKDLIEKILNETKITTRRVWKKPRVKVHGIYKVKSKLYSKEFHCKIKVLKIYKEKLKEMTELDALVEGFDGLDEFKIKWYSINGSWNPEQEVYVINFELVK